MGDIFICLGPLKHLLWVTPDPLGGRPPSVKANNKGAPGQGADHPGQGSTRLFSRARLSRGFRDAFTRFPPGFRQVFARFSQGFRKVFARLSLQKYFRERLGRAEKSLINFCAPRGPPPHRAAEPGPPRHAKIGKNHRNQRSTPSVRWKRAKNCKSQELRAAINAFAPMEINDMEPKVNFSAQVTSGTLILLIILARGPNNYDPQGARTIKTRGSITKSLLLDEHKVFELLLDEHKVSSV